MAEQMSAKISSYFIICALGCHESLSGTQVRISKISAAVALSISHSHSLSVKIFIELQIFSQHNVALLTDIGPKQPDLFSCHFNVIPETEVQCFS
jgi:hypothetical protein